MPKLLNLKNMCPIGAISAEDLAYLRAKMMGKTMKSATIDHHWSREAIETLKSDADAAGPRLHQLLSDAMGTDRDLDLGISDVDPAKPFKIHGRMLEKGQPCPFVKVEAYDEHPIADAWLGGVFTETDGNFLLAFDHRQFRADAALLLVVSRRVGNDYKELISLRPKILPGKELLLGDVDIAE